MSTIRRVGRHVGNLARTHLPGLPAPVNSESTLPHVSGRPTVNPVLPVHDMDVVMAFYRSIGFAVNAYDASYAWVRTCGWEFFHLVLVPTLESGSSAAGAYIHVSDVDDWHRAMCANAPDAVIGDVTEQPWGMREFAVTDPAGNVVRIGRHTERATGTVSGAVAPSSRE